MEPSYLWRVAVGSCVIIGCLLLEFVLHFKHVNFMLDTATVITSTARTPSIMYIADYLSKYILARAQVGAITTTQSRQRVGTP